tara:strand:+ start:1338 stop:2246 length:909 start_codon:yes stop_codon:yes gene_type:complete
MKILVIHYSQTGQLTEILDNLTAPFDGTEHELDHVRFSPDPNFDFPWSKSSFFEAMPDCVLSKGCTIAPFKVGHAKYDLVIFGYQPWFLSPSIPTHGILDDSTFQNAIKDTPVITVIGARNMWINAHKEVSKRIKESGGEHIGNIPLIDRNSNLLSAVSIMHWMFKGTKNKKWGLFPKPGISDKDIAEAGEFGVVIKNYVKNRDADLQQSILSLEKINIHWTIVFIEKKAKRLFKIWANIIVKKGTTPLKRKRWLLVFRFYLIFALFVVSPIILTIYTLLIRPFVLKRERQEKRLILLIDKI